MKEIVFKIYNRVGIKSDRTRNIVKHIGWSFLFKGGGVIVNFMLVPLIINYLDTENYGVWLTLSSFISWFSFFDIGLGNGLRNKFAEAKAQGNYENAQAFVSTAYFTIGSVSIFLIFVFLGINQFIDWAQLFNTNVDLQRELSLLLPIVFTFFALQLVMKLITSIYQADQNHSIYGKVEFVGQVLSLIIIWLLTKMNNSSLLVFGSVFSALPVLILVFLNFFAFKNTYKRFKPKFSLWRGECLKEITGLGFKFFVIQIAALVLFTTDNFIISKIYGPKEVVPFNIVFKYFSIVTMVYVIIITPYWSSFTEAYEKKDFQWIKTSVSNIQKIWLVVPVVLVVMIFFSDWFYEFWIGNKINVPIQLSITMALYVLVLTFNVVYNFFINGVGKIKLHLVISVLIMVLNIPLSLFFAEILGFKVSGIVLGSIVCLLLNVAFMPIQYHKLVNNKATGIWNK